MRVYLFETKTSSEDIQQGSVFWRRTQLDPQISLYLPAIRSMGHDPRGCLYDVLRKCPLQPSAIPLLDVDGVKIVFDKTGQRVRTKDGKKWRQTADTEAGYVLQSRPETPEEYGQRCLDAIAAEPSRYYARGVVVRLEADEKEAAADVWNTASQMRQAKHLNIYPRNPDSCVSWGRECDYLGPCSNTADINDPVLFRYEADEHPELEPEEPSNLDLLTQSGFRAFRSCQRKYQLRYVMRMRPLKQPETLSTGKSVHEALEVYRKTSDLDAAKKALTTEDPFIRAKEVSMVIGYAAYWGVPVGFIEVEKQFRVPLINPETGGTSRTFALGGKVDGIVSVESAKQLLNPVSVAPHPPTLDDKMEKQLEMSLTATEGKT